MKRSARVGESSRGISAFGGAWTGGNRCKQRHGGIETREPSKPTMSGAGVTDRNQQNIGSISARISSGALPY